MRAWLRPSGSRYRDACRLESSELRRRPRSLQPLTHHEPQYAVPSPRSREPHPHPPPASAPQVQQSGVREKNRAVGRSGRRGVPMPRRDNPAHWRDESRGRVRRPTSPVLPATFAGDPVPGSAHSGVFSRTPGPPVCTRPVPGSAHRSVLHARPGATCDPKPRLKQAARPPVLHPPRANYPNGVLSACNQTGSRGVACPLKG
jgi:hypothetical protein